ncbi:hypothetical protein F5Y03DRAFT_400204 [Xylaria venustula]|nr:hypothetical protein F5Y03DRAFT_400204 [Xylaria venustula]
MTNPDNLDLPIALRRTPRNCTSNAIPAVQVSRTRVVSAPLPAILKTPSKPRPKKRVRFSDPGPELSQDDVADEICCTGLTPMVKRSTLGEPSPKRRRASTGAQETATQKRNTKPRARKGTAAKVEAEVERLRAELADRDAEIERLHNETLVHDTERILELEQQVEALRAEIAQQQLPPLTMGGEDEDNNMFGDAGYDLPAQSFYDWTLAPSDPFSDSCLDEDSNFTPMEIICSTPTRKSTEAGPSKAVSAPLLSPPCTSPPMPSTPFSARKTNVPTTPQSHVGVQASLPDPEKEALEAELGSLRLELTKLTETLDIHAALQARLSEKLSTINPVSSPDPSTSTSQPQLEESLNTTLQTLSERTATLEELNASLDTLGFAGADAGEIIASIASGFRAARLELEYLTPGEITLPLNSHAAEVLDMVLVRLRDLARKSREDDDAIDEYHAIELSLRQQLRARVDVMDGMREEATRNATALRERDARIAELEVGLDRLKGAAEGYRRDIGELEALVQRLEGEGKDTDAKQQDAQTRLAEREVVVAELETKLAETLKQAEELETKLKDVQRRRDAEAKVRNKSYGAALALRDARMMELRKEIHGVNESLRSAHGVIMKLRVEKIGLERRVVEAEEGRRLAIEAVETMKAELEKVTAAAAAAAPSRRRRTRSSSAAAKGLATPEPQPGSYLSGDLARRSGAAKGKGRRKYDSGLGFLDEDEDGIEDGIEAI